MLASVSPNFSSVLSEWLSSVTCTSTVSDNQRLGIQAHGVALDHPESSIFLMRLQAKGLRPTAWPISCRLARALACSTARIFCRGVHAVDYLAQHCHKANFASNQPKD
jgi:hypothetical protein